MGGVGLSNLQYEMEAQQVMILLRHLCANTPLGRVMEVLIQQYQLWGRTPAAHSHRYKPLHLDTGPLAVTDPTHAQYVQHKNPI